MSPFLRNNTTTLHETRSQDGYLSSSLPPTTCSSIQIASRPFADVALVVVARLLWNASPLLEGFTPFDVFITGPRDFRNAGVSTIISKPPIAPTLSLSLLSVAYRGRQHIKTSAIHSGPHIFSRRIKEGPPDCIVSFHLNRTS